VGLIGGVFFLLNFKRGFGKPLFSLEKERGRIL
jgi:hypothetical protein